MSKQQKNEESPNIVYIPSVDALAYVPLKETAEVRKGVEAFGESVNRFANEHPEYDLVICVAGGFRVPAIYPAYNLVSNPFAYDDAIAVLSGETAGQANLNIVSVEDYASLASYYDDYFKSDHHWNIRGAYKAYEQIADILGLPLFEPTGLIGFGDYRFMGANARAGLNAIGETVYDYEFDFSSLRYDDIRNSEKDPINHENFYGLIGMHKITGFHGTYYNNMDTGTISGGHGDRRILLVSSSYGAIPQRLLALSSASLTRSGSLHLEMKNQTLENDLSHRCDAIVFCATPDDYATFMSRNPLYFD